MYFPPEDDFLNPNLHIQRLESIEKDLIEHMEKLQDPSVIIEYQKRLNKLLKTKMEWMKLKDKLEILNNGL